MFTHIFECTLEHILLLYIYICIYLYVYIFVYICSHIPLNAPLIPSYTFSHTRINTYSWNILNIYTHYSNTFTHTYVQLPANIIPKLDFAKGTGFRDSVVRFSGFTTDVRQAIMNMVYNTKLDESLQYKNQYSSDINLDNNPCSRPCFLQDLGPRLFAGLDEAPGCEQSCSKFIYDRINNFTTDEKVCTREQH